MLREPIVKECVDFLDTLRNGEESNGNIWRQNWQCKISIPETNCRELQIMTNNHSIKRSFLFGPSKSEQVNHGEPTSIIATSASASIEWTSIYLNAMKQAKWCTANDLVMFNETYPSLILLDRRAGPSCPQCMKISTGKCHLPLRQQLIIVESEMGGGSGQISPSFQDRFKL